MGDFLGIKGLVVAVEGKKVVDGLDLKIGAGELHVVMGPNGSGKSSFCKAVMGHPRYEILGGEVLLDGENLVGKKTDFIAQKGVFLGFQHPVEVKGVTFGNFMRIAVNEGEAPEAPGVGGKKKFGVVEFYPVMHEALLKVKMDKGFLGRSLNDGFSGGEKKKAEIVQMGLLKPRFALLDEIDSGLDVDALRYVTEGIRDTLLNGTGVLLITHYNRILEYLEPDFVHVMIDGKIVKSGSAEFAKELEKDGYEKFI